MAVRGLRGATRLQRDDAAEMHEAVAELVGAMLERNGLAPADLVSVVLTATPDLRCAFPAAALRGPDFDDVPLLCAAELAVTGAMERVVRVLAHVQTPAARADVRHVYLRGTDVLRAGRPS